MKLSMPIIVSVQALLMGVLLGCITPENPDWPDDPVPLPTFPTTTTTTQPAPSQADEVSEGLDMSKVTVHGGEDFRNAKITVKMLSANADKNGCTPQWERYEWPHYDANCDGFICVIYKVNGKWEGGKFDWLPMHRTSYHWSFKHVYAGYKAFNKLPRGHIAPPTGCRAGVFLLSVNRSERSKVCFFDWE